MTQTPDVPTEPAADQTRRYLSPHEFSRLSGLSLATVHRYLKTGKLPFCQPAGRRGRILIPADALAAAGPATLPDEATAGSADPASPSPTHRLSGPRPRWARQAGPTQATED
jgi:hypothetical protein